MIRPANITDIERICLLGNNTKEFETSDDVVLFWPEHVLRNSINSSEVIINVAEINASIVGFIIVSLNHSLEKATLENIYVNPDLRQHGIGKKLFEKTLLNIKEHAISNIVVLAEQKKETLEFYKKLGFDEGVNFVWLDMILDESFKK